MTCLYCGAPAEHAHHFTAGAGPVVHMDPATVPLCHRCHHAEHQAWRLVGLDRLDDPLAARLARVVWTVGRLAGLGRPVTLDPGTLGGFHAVLVVVRDETERRGLAGSGLAGLAVTR